METIYEKYMALPIDKGSLCLEYGDIADPYFCYPVNANPIGFEGCILYCFLPEYGEMVFAANGYTFWSTQLSGLQANTISPYSGKKQYRIHPSNPIGFALTG